MREREPRLMDSARIPRRIEKAAPGDGKKKILHFSTAKA